MSKKTVYYLEDTPGDFEILTRKISENLTVNILPLPIDWKDELKIFVQYLDERSESSKQAVIALLKNKDVDLIILDQEVKGFKSVGKIIYEQIILNDEELKQKIKAIVFSGATEEQDLPKSKPECVEVIRKRLSSMNDTADTICVHIKLMLELPRTSVSDYIQRILDRFNNIT